MRVYEGTPEEDAALLHWWAAMGADGELTSTFGRGAQALHAFLAMLQPPSKLIYEVDEQGIWLAFLMQPCLEAVFLSVWIAPRRRASRAALRNFELAYAACLSEVPVVFGFTREALLGAHRRWGYTIAGHVPSLFDGAGGWLVTITETDWLAARAARKEERHGRQQRRRSRTGEGGGAGAGAAPDADRGEDHEGGRPRP